RKKIRDLDLRHRHRIDKGHPGREEWKSPGRAVIRKLPTGFRKGHQTLKVVLFTLKRLRSIVHDLKRNTKCCTPLCSEFYERRNGRVQCYWVTIADQVIDDLLS